MKRCLLILFLVALLLCCGFAAQAEDTVWKYRVSGDGCIITGYNGSGETAAVPETLDGFPVIGITESAFSQHHELRTLTIPDHLTQIDPYAFSTLGSLVVVCRLNTETGQSLAGCLLTTVRSPSQPDYNIKLSMADGVLYAALERYLGSETEVILPRAIDDVPVAAVGKNTFYLYTAIQKVVVPDSVTRIEASAFSGQKRLQTLYLPDGISFIGEKALFNSTMKIYCGVDSQTADTLMRYGWTEYYAEAPDYTLRMTAGENGWTASIYRYTGAGGDVTIPAAFGKTAVTAIDNAAFQGCQTLTGIVIPEGVRTIGHSAFYEDRALASVVLPESLTYVSGNAFEYCTGLLRADIYAGRLDESLLFLTSPKLEQLTLRGSGAVDEQ